MRDGELDKAKTEAKSELTNVLNKYNKNDYTEENWNILKQKKVAGDNAIDVAKTIEEVTTAKENAKQNMKSVKTKAELDAEELASSIKSVKDSKNSGDLLIALKSQKLALKNIIDENKNEYFIEHQNTPAMETVEDIQKNIINAGNYTAKLHAKYLKSVDVSNGKKTVTVVMKGELFFKDGKTFKELVSDDGTNGWYTKNFKLNDNENAIEKVTYDSAEKTFTITLKNALNDNDKLQFINLSGDNACFTDSEGKKPLNNIIGTFDGTKFNLNN